jgi:hypothetical protein
MFKKYPDGFYVRAKDTINNKKGMIKHGRYIRHPAVAESRISSYDGEEVVFWYEDDDKVKHFVTMEVEEFISAIIDHIPEKNFKTIRHYGIYSRGLKRKFKRLLGIVIMAQRKITDFIKPWAPTCPKCGCRMEFLLYEKGEPPPEYKFGERITDREYISNSFTHQ